MPGYLPGPGRPAPEGAFPEVPGYLRARCPREVPGYLPGVLARGYLPGVVARGGLLPLTQGEAGLTVEGVEVLRLDHFEPRLVKATQELQDRTVRHRLC